MLLTSYKYVLFVLLGFCVYYTVGWFARRARGGRHSRPEHGGLAQNLTMLVLGYGFYALWDWRWCLLLAGVTLSGFGGALLLSKLKSHRRLVLVAALVLNLAALGFFKYFDFFAESFASLLGAAGLRADWVTLNLVLPVGLSYYVFQNLSYVIDVYRGDVERVAGPVEYAAALSFFPALLAGPITRPRDLVPQLRERRDFDEGRARDGLRQMLWGFFKKMLVADTIGLQIDHVWGDLGAADGVAAAAVAVLYSIQIYCDFSGYADIAIGTGKLLNLQLSKNFDHPYFATSVREFWRRWHMTLSGWMRDYLYIPLGGNRVKAVRNALNVLVTFLLVGLWHGAAWTFVVWGALHGLYLVVENSFRAWGRRRTGGQSGGKGPWREALAGVAVFAAVTIAWVFFRAPSLAEAVEFLGRGFVQPWGLGDHARYLPALLLGGGVMAYEWLTRRLEHGLALTGLPVVARWAVYLVCCLALVIFGQLGGREGIYVQF